LDQPEVQVEIRSDELVEQEVLVVLKIYFHNFEVLLETEVVLNLIFEIYFEEVSMDNQLNQKEEILNLKNQYLLILKKPMKSLSLTLS
jgi:dTDP-4-dehydrorhamnose 3,5-epimerase-like enzyme